MANGSAINLDKYLKDFFVYSAVATAIAPAGTQTQQVLIQADSDFLVQKMTFSANIANAAQTANSRVIPLVNILITDTGSGRQIMDRALPIPTMFGTGELPFILPIPKVFRANTAIQIQFSNYDVASTYNIQLDFIGVKLYPL